jgi:hypothetical protein
MQSAADHFPVARRFDAATVHRDQRLNRHPLLIVQPILVRHSDILTTILSIDFNLSAMNGFKVIKFSFNVASDLPLLQIGGRSGKTASAHPKA